MRLPWKRRRRSEPEVERPAPSPEAVKALREAQHDVETTRDQYVPVLLRAERMRAWRSDAVNHFAESMRMAYGVHPDNPGGSKQ